LKGYFAVGKQTCEGGVKPPFRLEGTEGHQFGVFQGRV
jgi:hypothetical protein